MKNIEYSQVKKTAKNGPNQLFFFRLESWESLFLICIIE